MRGWAFVNLLVVVGIGAAAAFALPDDVFDRNKGGLGAALNGGNGGLALGLARRHNLKRRTNPE
jgi:hypothetical protein